MKLDEIGALLEKYQRGLCSDAERKAVEEWYESLQLGEEKPLEESDLNESLSRVRANLPGMPGVSGTSAASGVSDMPAVPAMPGDSGVWGESATPVYSLRRGGRIAVVWKIAAAAAIITVLGGAIWLYSVSRSTGSARLSQGNATNDSIVVTGRGETRQVVLADGTSVQLNAGTAFRYPRVFQGKARSVQLIRGEAFFQVVSDPARPFTVDAGGSHTVVLGTSFNIRAYPQEPDIRIALLTGKVQVADSNGGHRVRLKPHQQVRIEHATGRITAGRFEESYEVAAWREGAMCFRDASFEAIALEVGNKYNIDMVNLSSKGEWSYTGLFREESLQEVVETICQTEGLGYEFRDNHILIINKK